jgi:phenylalanyl-tRNA synthetase alpha chain
LFNGLVILYLWLKPNHWYFFKHWVQQVSEGPEIEDDWHNFTALNLPEYHPAWHARHFFHPDRSWYCCVRTHHLCRYVTWKTTNPYTLISSGKVFVMVSRSLYFPSSGRDCISTKMFRLLIWNRLCCIQRRCSENQIRLRPFFSFTEPSAEIDIGD